MNRKQYVVLTVAATLFALSELFPPWLYEDGLTSAQRSAGFHFVFAADPPVKPYSEMKRVFSIPDDDLIHGFTVHKDSGRLLGQRLLIPILAIAFLLGFADRRTRLKAIFAGVSGCVGMLLAALYALYVSRYY